jgi:2-methylfumaryl-CoA isomerase
MYNLLQGVRIVELSAFVAVPSCGNTLAKLGAHVVRVDPPEGGLDYRRWPLSKEGGSIYWAGLNHAKSSFSADLSSATGQAAVLDLCAAADAVITNLSPKWLGYDALRSRRADIVFATLEGHADGRTAVDYTINAASGLPLITGNGGAGAPVNNPLPVWDIVAGYALANAILAALHRRRDTGQGAYIKLSLHDVMAATMSSLGFTGEAEINGEERPALGNHIFGTFGHDFAIADNRHVMVVAVTLRQWNALIAATGLGAEMAALAQQLNLDFAQEGDRYRARHRIVEALAPWFRDKGLADLKHAFGGTAVCWEPYQSVGALAGSLAGNAIFEAVDHPGAGCMQTVGTAFELSGEPRGKLKPVSAIGADSAEVLARFTVSPRTG